MLGSLIHAIPLLAANSYAMGDALPNIFDAQSPYAGAISSLFVVTLIICAVIFAIVTAIVVYALVKYRYREGDPEPPQFAGHKTLEIVWTAIPLVIVFVLFVLTVQAMRAVDPPHPPDPDIVFTGRQWWWDVHYPKSGVITANEIHIPVGQPMAIRLESADVLHAFWVPQLTRQMTNIPGTSTNIWLRADKPGVYFGICTEYCGTQHAWMRFKVIAHPPEEFEAWQKAQLVPAPAPAPGAPAPVPAMVSAPPPSQHGVHGGAAAHPTATGGTLAVAGDPGRGWEVFKTMSCISCHAVAGTEANVRVGPDLTHFASRAEIGAGILPMSPENITRWMRNPQAIKPGVKMPNFGFTEQQLADLSAYLQTLK